MEQEQEPRSDWQILRDVLAADSEAWKANIEERQLKLKLETDPLKMQKLQNDSAVLSIYLSASEHYLDVMNSIEAARGGTNPAEES